jgi:hypothetical protein
MDDFFYRSYILDRYGYYADLSKLPQAGLKERWWVFAAKLKFDLGVPLFGKNYFRQYIFHRNDPPYKSGFRKSDKSKLHVRSLQKVINTHYDSSLVKVSETNINYLGKIVELCENKGIKLFLITTPLSEDYREMTPVLMKLKFYEIIKDVGLEKNVEYYDFSEYSMQEDHFSDHNHLNILGAAMISELVDKMIRGE